MDAYKANLAEEDGIGSGGMWPSDLLHCDDNNLLDNIFSSFAKTQRDAESEDFFDNFDHTFFLTLLNPEPLLAQILPTSVRGSEFWPGYLGACGRLAVFEDMGNPFQPLAQFLLKEGHLYSSWDIRAELALQLIRLTTLLTKNDLGLSFYLTDWAPENFAVLVNESKRLGTPGSLKVSLIDLEHLIVVNTSRLEEEGAAAHISDNWGSSTSLSFSPPALCEHSSSDHNILGLCGVLLAPSPMSSIPGGLLHSPQPGVLTSNLDELLLSCWQSTKVGGRETALKQLQLLLEQELAYIAYTRARTTQEAGAGNEKY